MRKTELFLALVRCSFLTCAEKEVLANKLDNLESLTVLSIEDICVMIGRRIRTGVYRPRELANFVERDLESMRRYGIGFVPVMSADFPPLLRELHDPPFAVFWRGKLPEPEKPLAAVVGTRAPTGNGALAALRLGLEFAESGVPVVSGLARGIDAFAHRGNADARGKSIAVLACGVDQIYPRSNARLAARMIEEGGCILGEYPPGESPLKFRFPQRNRIISGLSRAVVVVEAPEKSGALITADFALEQGRDLFVCSGTLDSSRGAGCRRLFSEGAPAIHSAFDILASWDLAGNATAVNRGSDSRVALSCDIPRFPGRADRSRGIEWRPGPEEFGKQLAFEFGKELDLMPQQGSVEEN